MGGTFSGATIEGIPIGANRIIKAEACKTLNNVTAKLAGVSLSAVVNIRAGVNEVELSWSTTAMGRVYEKLLSLDYDISTLERESVQNLIPVNTHAALIDTDAIAEDIKEGITTDPDCYKKTPGTITIKSNVQLDMGGVEIFVSDPTSRKANSLIITQTLSNIAPGDWTLYVIIKGAVLYEKPITIESGDSKEVTIDLKMRPPRLESKTGEKEDESVPKDGNKTIYLRVRGDIEGEEAQECSIYYNKTTDGSDPADPTVSSTLYVDASGVVVSSGDKIKAIATKRNFQNSDPVIFTFSTPTIGYVHPASGAAGTPVDENTWGTASWALGAKVNGTNTEFALYSANASKVLLEIYDNKSGADAKWDYWMKKGSDNIWRAKVLVGEGTFYAYRAWGPNWPFDNEWVRGNSDKGFKTDCDSAGNRFNPNKLCFDPRARELSHDKSNPTVMEGVDGGIYGTGADPIKVKSTDPAAVPRRNIDTGKYAPKGVVIDDKTSFGTKPEIPAIKAVIYEAHARGLTKHPSVLNLTTILGGVDGFDEVGNIPEAKRGTYAGAALMVPYLKALGVNTIELLPVHESDNDANPDNESGGNYWAYMTYGYYAPDRRYSSDKTPGGPTKEFKAMVKAFHDAGMEVYLDVVYNHSGEGGVWGSASGEDPTTAEITFMRGLDNKTYYELTGGGNAYYYNHTGCGNDLQCDNEVVRAFILDSLTYWIEEMGVDGFRFDLAPVLGHVKNAQGGWNFNGNAQTLVDIAKLGTDNKVEMIAEAWDAGGCYCVGSFPSGWGEWNGRYRDNIRSYVGTGRRGGANTYIHGDYDHFNDQGGPSKSVNFIVAHDGFTLADLSTYGGAGNGANANLEWPFGPSDGGNGDNNSVPDSTSEGKRQTHRNYLAIQAISRGVPMIVWGDEFGRTQNGNNNPYNVDSVATWNNYNMINTKEPHKVATGGGGAYHNNFGTFGLKDAGGNTGDKAYGENLNGNFILTKYLLNLRQKEPAFNVDNYSVTYNYETEGGEGLEDRNNCERIYIAGSAVTGGSDYCVLLNLYDADQNPYTIPTPPRGKVWKKLVDTQKWFEPYHNCWEEKDAPTVTGTYNCGARSIVILKACDAVFNVRAETPIISGTEKFSTTSSVTITTATPGADIYYTTDGTTPTKTVSSTNLKYNGPVSISDTSLIRAIAVKEGISDSFLGEKLFIKTVSSPISSGAGVMLQGFNWESAKKTGAANWYTVITNNATTIKNSFAYIWLPPPSASNGDAPQGYMPTELNNLNNRYGTEAELNTMLTALNSGGAGTKPIADIVINHRAGTSCWGDFTNPTFGTEVEKDSNNKVTAGVNYRAICSDDEGFENDEHMRSVSLNMRGAADTGEGYAAARDLDHTNLDVQYEIIKWLQSLKTKGFVGWRYDFVKGYSGQYVGLYNSATGPGFSIGEYWPSTGDWARQIDSWVAATETGGSRSKAFDFVLKSNLNALYGFKNGDNATQAGDGNYTHMADATNLFLSHPSDAVTFVDNHDTGSTQHHWKMLDEGVPLSYVLILTHPGTPCVAWQHYFNPTESGVSDEESEDYKQYNMSDKPVAGTIPSGAAAGTNPKTLREHIDTLIALRKAAGIECDSNLTILKSASDVHSVKIAGKTHDLIVKLGPGSYTPDGSSGWAGKHAVYAGDDFVIWEKDVDGTYGNEIPDTIELTAFITTPLDKNRNLWVWCWPTGQDGQWVKGTPESGAAYFTIPRTNINVTFAEFEKSITPTGNMDFNKASRRTYKDEVLTIDKGGAMVTITFMVKLTSTYNTYGNGSIFFSGSFPESKENGTTWVNSVRGTCVDNDKWSALVTDDGYGFEWKPFKYTTGSSDIIEQPSSGATWPDGSKPNKTYVSGTIGCTQDFAW